MAAGGEEITPTLATADQLNLENKFEETWACLTGPDVDGTSVPILWRKARACYDMADTKPDDKKWKEQWYRDGLGFAKAALDNSASNPSYGAHKWYSILLSAVGDFSSTKEKIQNSFEIKNHALKALELKPKDPTTLHLIGRWCYSVAGIGWMERKIAAAAFGTPPESSYAEAVEYFSQANESHKWPTNLYYLGLALEGAGDKAKAKAAFQEGAAVPPKSKRDEIDAANCRKKI